MPRFTVNFSDGSIAWRHIDAEYYRHEDGWTTFKDADHKVVHDFPDHVIASIRRDDGEAAPPTVTNVMHVHAADHAGDALDRVRTAAKAAAKQGNAT